MAELAAALAFVIGLFTLYEKIKTLRARQDVQAAALHRVAIALERIADTLAIARH